MSVPARMTPQTLAVLAVFANDPTAEHYGLEIARATGLKAGTVQPILDRFAGQLWLQSRWEPGDPETLGRARRLLFKLTAIGRRRVAAISKI